MANSPPIGTIGWCDLTVPDAPRIREFYQRVVGWTASSVPMGDYEDYCLQTPGNEQTVAGICHQRGVNSKIPSQWLMYIQVECLERSIHECQELGGRVIDGPRSMESYGTLCVIEDPAGAVVALLEAPLAQP